jgi:hypothetical protein
MNSYRNNCAAGYEARANTHITIYSTHKMIIVRLALGHTQILPGPNSPRSCGEMYAVSKRITMDLMCKIIVVLPALGRTHVLPDTGSCEEVYAISKHNTLNAVPMYKHRNYPHYVICAVRAHLI